jgi:hypothetical protein
LSRKRSISPATAAGRSACGQWLACPISVTVEWAGSNRGAIAEATTSAVISGSSAPERMSTGPVNALGRSPAGWPLFHASAAAVADEDERLADGVDDSAQVGGEPVEGYWPGCRGAVPEAGLVKLDGLEPGRRQPGEDRSPDVLIIEKAVHEHEGPAAVAVTTEHDVTVRDGGCGGHAVSLPVKPVRMSDLSLVVLLLSTVRPILYSISRMGDLAWYAAMSSMASW